MCMNLRFACPRVTRVEYSNPTGFVKKGAGDFFRGTQRVPGPKSRFALRAFTTQIGVLYNPIDSEWWLVL